MNYKEVTQKVAELAIEVGNFIHGEKDKFSMNKVEFKGFNDFVSYVDKSAEQQIIDGLQNLVPNAGYIAEEGTVDYRGDEYNWIIDPLDGTTNFIHGLFPCAVSIALQHNDELVVGVVYEVGLKECFCAWKDGGAYLNGKSISVNQTESIDNSLIATGFPYSDYTRIQGFQQTLEYFMRNSHGIRRLGSAATDLVYVACGRFEAFYEYSLKPWDVAAGALIVQEAGGKVCDFSGGNNYLFGKEIVATNAHIFSPFKELIANYLNN